MTSDAIRRFFVLLFVLGFFAYLFGPLILMSITAFNSSAFPRVMPWECFSSEWFGVLLADQRLMNGLRNSVVIGLGVVVLAVPLGLAGALLLTQVSPRLRPWYYTIIISPILVPGVVLGIATLIFWDRLGTMFGASHESLFYNGFFLTVIGQSAFIAAYTMLVFIARLQRFDPALEEAALDLGATHVQTFRKVLLPFLKPAIASAAVLAFLASFENYNTTVFTIISESTLTTVLASKVRYGINPSISALAVVIVVLTLFGACLHEVIKRRELAEQKAALAVAASETAAGIKRIGLFAQPALYIVLAVFIAGIGTAFFAGTVGVEECKTVVKEEKRLENERRVQKLQQQRMFEGARPGQTENDTTATTSEDKPRAKGTEGYQNIFAPQNLEGQAQPQTISPPEDSGEKPQNKPEAPGTQGYQNIFAPDNLRGQPPSDQEKQ
jgi:spermidine/putrescine transport system permease protein